MKPFCTLASVAVSLVFAQAAAAQTPTPPAAVAKPAAAAPAVGAIDNGVKAPAVITPAVPVAPTTPAATSAPAELVAPAIVAAPAAARAAVPPKPVNKLEIIKTGLAESMKKAGTLMFTNRLAATGAMDDALHLSEFAVSSPATAGTSRAPFAAALETVKTARLDLQMGRTEKAVRELVDGGRQLLASPVAMPADSGVRSVLGDVYGVNVLNQYGRLIGWAGELEGSGAAPKLIVKTDSFYGIGGKLFAVPAAELLFSHDWIVVAQPSEKLADVPGAVLIN